MQVANSFINECARIPGNHYGVIVGPSLQKLINPTALGENFTLFNVDKRPAQEPLRAFGGGVFDAIQAEFKPDVVFTTSGPAYWKAKAPHLIGYNLPHYIYPESPYFKRCPLKERLNFRIKEHIIKYFYNRDADALVVQTDDVNERVRKLLRCDDVTTVPNTCGSYFFSAAAEQGAAPFLREEGKRYLLYLTAYYPHKNIEIINAVAPLLEKRAPGRFIFVLTLPQEAFEQAIRPEAAASVINIGPVPPQNCPALYSACDYTFLPTLLECFSASYAESMAMGRPILTSDMGFARTVCEKAARYFDPVHPQAIAESILTLDADPQLQQELVRLGKERLNTFCSARQRAERYLQICERLAGGK